MGCANCQESLAVTDVDVSSSASAPEQGTCRKTEKPTQNLRRKGIALILPAGTVNPSATCRTWATVPLILKKHEIPRTASTWEYRHKQQSVSLIRNTCVPVCHLYRKKKKVTDEHQSNSSDFFLLGGGGGGGGGRGVGGRVRGWGGGGGGYVGGGDGWGVGG